MRDRLDQTGVHVDICTRTHKYTPKKQNGHTQTDHYFIIHMSCLCVRQGFYSRRAAFHTLSVLQKESCVCVCVCVTVCVSWRAHAVRAAMLEVKWL